MKMGQKHLKAHKAFLDLAKPFSAQKVYEAMCKLVDCSEENIERGLGKLFREGKMKNEERRPKPGKSGRSGGAEDDFR